MYSGVFLSQSNLYFKQRTGQDHVDIITFYNKVFIPSVKPLLVELGPAGSKLQNNQPPEDCSSADGTSLFFFKKKLVDSAIYDCVWPNRPLSRTTSIISISKSPRYVSQEGVGYTQCVRLSTKNIKGILICQLHVVHFIHFLAMIYRYQDESIKKNLHY